MKLRTARELRRLNNKRHESAKQERPAKPAIPVLHVKPAAGIAVPGDQRYVVGASCNWHGPIQEARPFDVAELMPPALREMLKHLEEFATRTAPEGATDRLNTIVPVCPWCAGPLGEVENAAAWWEYWAGFAVANEITAYYREWLEANRKKHCVPFSRWDGPANYKEFVKGLAIQ